MPARRVGVICTVLNEEGAMAALLASLSAQTRQPDEIVIVDGGSTDGTMAIIERSAEQGLPVRLLVQPGCNISQGRNLAIKACQAEIIASTDCGVRLVPDWLADLARPFEAAGDEGGADVVCGFFASDPHSLFEVAMGATVLPVVEEIDSERFLPSSRSVAFRKEAWARVGGYPEWLDYCEDLIFDLSLRRAGCKFVFAPSAVAYFRPRSSLSAYFKQYYRYGRGDGKAGLWPRRHLIRYGSYVGGALVFTFGFWYKVAWFILLLAGLAYLHRPYRRLLPVLGGYTMGDRLRGIALVPIIRLVGDIAKMVGYPAGILWRRRRGARLARP